MRLDFSPIARFDEGMADLVGSASLRRMSQGSALSASPSPVLRALTLSIALVATLVLVGCRKEPAGGTAGSLDLYETSQAPPAKVEETAAPPVEAAKPTETPEPSDGLPSDDLCRQFAAKWVQVHYDNDTLAAYQLVDWARIYERALDAVDASPVHKEQFIRLRKSAVQSAEGVQKIVAQSIKRGDPFRFMRVRKLEGVKVAVFRLSRADADAPDYQLVELQPGPDGELRAADIVSLLTGLRYSDEIRTLFLDSLVANNLAPPGFDSTPARAVARMQLLMNENKPAEAFQFYVSMPLGLRRTKRCMLWLLVVARQLGRDVYTEALQQVCDQLPGDPSTRMMRLQLGLLRRNPQQVIDAVDQLELSVGQDAALEAIRASAWSQMGRPEDADKCILAALKEEPSLKDAYRVRLNILVKSGRFDEMAVVLLECQRNGGKVDEMVTWLRDPAFSGFVESKPYKAWAASRPKAAPVPEP